ncbi:MAG: hypothetical protein QOG05_4538 [Streptosporangiaceae bacterium]|jgi:hypothetical protein|nr:hypothetical protein [Streptosporangiaceae bacterium]
MSTEAKSSPPRGDTAILGLAALAFALAQTAVIPGMWGMTQSRTSTGVRSVGSRRFSPSLIVRRWHHRPGRGPVCPDKETP